MKFIFQKCIIKCLLLYTAILSVNTIWAQTCPPILTTGVTFINNTYFPGQQAMVNAGSTSIAIGAVAYGIIPISARDVLLIIQCRGRSKVITTQTVLSKEDILDISPVPAKRYTMIKWPSTGNSKLTITLFDVAGRFVLCRQYQLRKGINELLLTNLEALPASVYFIKASDGASYRNGKLRIQQ